MKDIKYYLASKEKSLNEILNFLSDAKKEYISLLNSKYIENPNLRLLYGKQFRSMMNYLEDNDNIDSILRYIVNNIDNTEIKEGTKGTYRTVTDFLNHKDNKDSLESISKFIYFINQQNEKMKNLFEEKDKYELNSINKVNVQQLEEEGRSNLKLPKIISFLDIIFNFSFWKMLDLYPNGYKSYK